MVFDAKELVMTKKNGKMTGNGYTIDSLLMHSGISPMTTENNANVSQKGGSIGVGGKFSDLFRSMGIPIGLSYALSRDVISGIDTHNEKSVNVEKESNGMVADSLYDKLLELAGPPQKNVDDSVSYVGGSTKKQHRKTKRKTNKAKRQTRRKHKKSNSKK